MTGSSLIKTATKVEIKLEASAAIGATCDFGYNLMSAAASKAYNSSVHAIVAWFIIIALVLLGIMWHDVYCISRVKSLSISIILIGGVFPVVFLLTILSAYITFCHELVMNKEGCMVRLWKIHRFYKWDELKVKRYENYKDMMYSTPRSLKRGYDEEFYFH